MKPTKSLQNERLITQSLPKLLHLQTYRVIDFPPNLPVVLIGKPNDRIAPDIDVSGFQNSDIVSRLHAHIRIEGNSYFIEDLGSANGTYVNQEFLNPGNRYRLNPGDKIGLGKGDLVTFIFQLF